MNGLALCVALASIGAAAVAVGPACQPLRPRPAGPDPTVGRPSARVPDTHVEQNHVEIPMRDGKRLVADLWMPRKPGRHAAVLFMTPYGRHLLGASLPDESAEIDLPDLDGKVLVLVDWRGFHGSRAAKGFGSVSLKDHGRDGVDVIRWIEKQPWSNGEVAMWGASASGKVQYAVAAEDSRSLACGVVLAAADGYSYEQFYTGGVLREAYAEMLSRVGYGSQWVLRRHPTKDALWKRVEQNTQNVPEVDVPLLLVTGWFDLDSGAILTTFEDLRERSGPRARAGSRLLVGPWHHTAFGKLRQGDLEFAKAVGENAKQASEYIDRCTDDQLSDLPLFTYYRMGHDQWRVADRFPPPLAPERRFFLTSDGRLSGSSPAQPATARGRVNGSGARARRASAPRDLVHDPEQPSRTRGGMNVFLRSDEAFETVGAGPRDLRSVLSQEASVLSYRSPVLDEDVVLEGEAKAILHVSSDRPDTDFAVRLCDEWPDGRCMLVTDGIQRMRFRSGAEKPELLQPGEIYSVEVALAQTAHAFLKGHRIRMVVSSANYPRFEVNPNRDRWRLIGKNSFVAHNQVYADSEHVSYLVLPRWSGTRER